MEENNYLLKNRFIKPLLYVSTTGIIMGCNETGKMKTLDRSQHMLSTKPEKEKQEFLYNSEYQEVWYDAKENIEKEKQEFLYNSEYQEIWYDAKENIEASHKATPEKSKAFQWLALQENKQERTPYINWILDEQRQIEVTIEWLTGKVNQMKNTRLVYQMIDAVNDIKNKKHEVESYIAFLNSNAGFTIVQPKSAEEYINWLQEQEQMIPFIKQVSLLNRAKEEKQLLVQALTTLLDTLEGRNVEAPNNLQSVVANVVSNKLKEATNALSNIKGCLNDITLLDLNQDKHLIKKRVSFPLEML